MNSQPRLISTAALFLAAFALSFATPNGSGSLGIDGAFAQGAGNGGGGRGGGAGGGRGGGHGGGHGGGPGGGQAAGHGDSQGIGGGFGNGFGRGRSGSDVSAEAHGRRGHGAVSSELGGLNAAHASPTAMANAAPDSQVGQIAGYRDAALGTAEAEAEVADIANQIEAVRAQRDTALAADVNADVTDLESEIADLEDALSDAQTDLDDARDAEDAALSDLTDRSLSDRAVGALRGMLGLGD